MNTFDAPRLHPIGCRCSKCQPVMPESQGSGSWHRRMRNVLLSLLAYMFVLIVFGVALIMLTVAS